MNYLEGLELFVDWVLVTLDYNREFTGPAGDWPFISHDAKPRAEKLGIRWDDVLVTSDRIDSIVKAGKPVQHAHLVDTHRILKLDPGVTNWTDPDTGTRWVRRSEDQHSSEFTRGTGGPRCGHWLFDHWGLTPLSALPERTPS